MLLFTRAAALAAAVLSIVAGAAFADPSQAFESTEAPVLNHYLDHARAGIDLAPIAPTIVQPGFEAVAPLASAPVAAPAEPAPRSLTQLVEDFASSDVVDAEHECLAGAVYYESKGEPLKGQLAVAEVVVNRAASGRFPSTLCGVVKQPSQFSFVRGGHIPPAPRASQAWKTAVAIARIARDELADQVDARTMFFHSARLSPGWRNRSRVASIGNHVFYR